ncbi:hypothetical protein JCGZ_14722 [Jatropha curcas]|uniref:ABC transporter domain-containing protein n=1 Tax=Jatropha curcas TaxID=180498 RepID=A0A067KL30_JATCU|nr:hypothetical protein JCGZ_14722 [Jatropha curcas]
MDLPVKSPVFGDQKFSYRLETNNLSYKLCSKFDELKWVFLGKTQNKPTKFILKEVTCEAKPGEITAIAGPSGAGKTTLLEILAGKISTNEVCNHVFVNDRPMNAKQFRRLSGYVTQDDALFPLLTVQETLMYSALLRLKGGAKEATNRVKRLMKELGLEQVANSRIGDGSNNKGGISGGERRRVSIGVDLVHDPSVVLIDEPTSGLDSASALHVTTLLKSMAVNQGKTIVLTIHQPGFRILQLLDHIVLLSNGFVMHNGSLQFLEQRLKLFGHHIPHHVNVLEFAIDVIETLEIQNPVSINITRRITQERSNNQELEFHGRTTKILNSPFEEGIRKEKLLYKLELGFSLLVLLSCYLQQQKDCQFSCKKEEY